MTNTRTTAKPKPKPVAAPKSADLSPATEVAASGATIEPEIATGVDMAHMAVDAEPRAASTDVMSQIDFNEPSALTSQEDAVEKNLAKA